MIVLATSGDRSAARAEWYKQRAAEHMGTSQAFTLRVRNRACFQAYKDIALPPMIPVPALIREYQGDRAGARDIRVYFRGTAFGSDKALAFNQHYSLGVRQYIVKHFRNRGGWLVTDETSPDTYHAEMLRSQLCLAPAGAHLLMTASIKDTPRRIAELAALSRSSNLGLVCVCMCACVRACVRARVHARVRAYVTEVPGTNRLGTVVCKDV